MVWASNSFCPQVSIPLKGYLIHRVWYFAVVCTVSSKFQLLPCLSHSRFCSLGLVSAFSFWSTFFTTFILFWNTAAFLWKPGFFSQCWYGLKTCPSNYLGSSVWAFFCACRVFPTARIIILHFLFHYYFCSLLPASHFSVESSSMGSSLSVTALALLTLSSLILFWNMAAPLWKSDFLSQCWYSLKACPSTHFRKLRNKGRYDY